MNAEERTLSTADVAAATSPAPAPANAQPADDAPIDAKPADRAPEGGDHAPLFSDTDASHFQDRWTDIQAGFVDEPRRAVEQADALVAEVMQHLARAFTDERQGLEKQWERGGDTNTEELRLALRRYRSFFSRLLAL